MTEPVVLYEEREAVAFVTINRPEKKNTLTEAVIQGIADGLERAKQYLLTGCEIDSATALRIGLVSEVHPAAELGRRVEEHARRFRNIPANQLALNKLLINQAYENMGLRTTQLLGTFFDGVTRHTEEAYRWAESFAEGGFRDVIRDRDRPWGDYGERGREACP
jgi:enoyl-CoA hydratase